jgi:hypothetical protein
MQGVARIIERPERAKIWWVHLVWVAHMMLTTVFWWWWEFRLRLVQTWTFPLYAFLLCYAFFIYLICALLFPSELGEHAGFKDYFLARRRWIFGMLIAWLAVDLLDTLAKGSAYFAGLGLGRALHHRHAEPARTGAGGGGGFGLRLPDFAGPPLLRSGAVG